MSVNRVLLVGHLGTTPELRYTPAQHPVCAMRLATTERRKTAAGVWEEAPEWHNVVVWGASAENCAKYLTKGREVCVEGKIQTRKWQDTEGAIRYRTEIVAQAVHFLGGKKATQEAAADAQAGSDPDATDPGASLLGDLHAPVTLDEDVPF